MVSYDGQFLHAMSTDSNSVDSYTSRVGASVISNQDFVTGELVGKKEKSAWMKQVQIQRLITIVTVVIAARNTLYSVTLINLSLFFVAFSSYVFRVDANLVTQVYWMFIFSFFIKSCCCVMYM